MEGDSDGCTTPRSSRAAGESTEQATLRATLGLILKILPLAVAAAINPTGILVVVALLATAERTALLLTAGFCTAFIACGVVALALGLRLELKPSTTSAVIDLVAAVIIV